MVYHLLVVERSEVLGELLGDPAQNVLDHNIYYFSDNCDSLIPLSHKLFLDLHLKLSSQNF
jgi:hypothetical protein